jgi:hypothetical protein
MQMDFCERLAHAYFFAKRFVIKRGYGEEIDWQDSQCMDMLTEEKFLLEISWVILASGMNDRIVSKVFPAVSDSFFNFQSAELISKKKDVCLNNALKFFNNKKKINAIVFIAENVHKTTFEKVKLKILNDGISYIQTFPFMGPATSLHLAKNIGLNFAKPDRHLLRISSSLGFSSPQELCQELEKKISEKISLIDLVIWRYATLDKHYLKNLSRFIRKTSPFVN